MSRGKPGVVLYRGESAIEGVVIAHGLAHGVFAWWGRCVRTLASADPSFGVAVPAKRDQDVLGHPGGNRHGGTLQSRYRAGPAHLNHGGVA